MATLREFFVSEASDYLRQLADSVQQLDTGAGDTRELHKQTRGLRGSAQMAREDRVYRAALRLEAAARSVSGGLANWSEDLSSRIRRTLEDIEALVNGDEDEDIAEGRVKRTVDRWQDMMELPTDSIQSSGPPASEASRQFQQFAAHEVAGIVNEMEAGLVTLASDPRNRDPLKAILRRQRALLGAARLDEIAVVAEALRATEDMTRVIAKLNVPVKEEWLSVFRSARDVLKAAIEPLRRGEIPGPTPALSKLRTLRQELLDRYGEGEAVAIIGGPSAVPPGAPASQPEASVAPISRAFPSAAQPRSASAPATPVPAATPDDEGVVPIESLLYQGPRALARALELQPAFERIAGDDTQAREQVKELFDLIRLGSA